MIKDVRFKHTFTRIRIGAKGSANLIACVFYRISCLWVPNRGSREVFYDVSVNALLFAQKS